MQRRVAERVGGIVEELRGAVLFENVLEEIGVVATRGFEEEFFGGGALVCELVLAVAVPDESSEGPDTSSLLWVAMLDRSCAGRDVGISGAVEVERMDAKMVESYVLSGSG